MKKITVFENAVYTKPLEKKFYGYCLRRQPALIKYLSVFIIYNFIRFFGIISQEKYLEKRWSFLGDVKDLDTKLERFFHKIRKSIFIPDFRIHMLSLHPTNVLNKFCGDNDILLYANTYNIYDDCFTSYKNIKELYEEATDREQGGIVFDKYKSVIKKSPDTFYIVYNKKVYESRLSYLLHQCFSAFLVFASIFVGAVVLGLISLYYGSITNDFTLNLFKSYFDIPWLVFLNILPIIFLMFILYVATNSVAVSFFITSVFTLMISWANYFKLLFRNDPVIAEDIFNIFEAKAMSSNYNVTIGNKMWVIIGCVILATVFMAFHVKGKFRTGQLRLGLFLVLFAMGIVGFKNIYLNTQLYNKTENLTYINKWSSTQQFTSRGFIYPVLYSFSYGFDTPVSNYNKKSAKLILSNYTDSDIPEDKKVNVVAVMLEAFADLSKFNQLEFNVDPYSYWHRLESESYSGNLLVNIFAGGTVSTERAFLSGYTALPSFRKPTNTYAWYFRNQGYKVEGSHPCFNWFYNRININKNMGFENYYFSEDTYTELSDDFISPDYILFPQIIKFYENATADGSPYFSFNVTYQGHGPYSSDMYFNREYATNKGYSTDEYNIINNYFESIYQTQIELEKFIDYFRNTEDPVVVILFGDHMPWMGNNNSVYKAMGVNFDFSTDEGFYNYYGIPYLIWANDSAKNTLGNSFTGEGPTMGPYFLMNEFFSLAGYEGNQFMKLSNEIKTYLPVIHVTDKYLENGNLTSTISDEANDILENFLNAQYYYKTHYNKK